MKQIQIELDNLKDSFNRIEEQCSDFDANLMYKVMFISEEIITNLARHADFQARTPDVILSLETTHNLLLTFKDNAKKFNMLEYPDPNIEEDVQVRELGGLGIFLTKKYAKKIEYLYEDGYNILRIEL